MVALTFTAGSAIKFVGTGIARPSPAAAKSPLFIEGGQIAKGDQGGEDIEAPPVCAKR